MLFACTSLSPHALDQHVGDCARGVIFSCGVQMALAGGTFGVRVVDVRECEFKVR